MPADPQSHPDTAPLAGTQETNGRAPLPAPGGSDMYRSLVEHALDAMLVADDQGRYVEANPAACELFGLPKNELLGKQVLDFVEPEQAAETAALWADFLVLGELEGELQILRPDGQTRDLEFRAVANFMPGFHLSVLRDVSKRKLLEAQVSTQSEALRAEHERLASLVNSADISLSTMDAEGRYLMVNRAWEERTGVTGNEVLGRGFAEFMDAENGARYQAILERVLATGEPAIMRELYAQTGSRPEGFYIDWVLQPLRDAHGNIERLLSVSIDVTEKVRARQEVEAQRALLETIFESAPVGIIMYDREMRIIRLNSEYARIARRDPTEVIGRSVYDLSPVAESRRPIYERVLAGETIDHSSFSYEFPGGEVRNYDVRYKPLRDADGCVSGILSTMLDVTDKALSEQALEAHRALLETIFSQAPVGFALFDRDMRFMSMNSEFSRMGRYDPESSIGHTIYEVRPSTRERAEVHRRVLAGESLDLENFTGPDTSTGGRTNYYDIRYRPVRDPAGEITGMLVTVVDVTERKEIDKQKDEFIALASHELKTPITAIKGFADMSARTADRLGDERLARMLRVINVQSDRLTRLINDLLEVSRLQSGSLALDLSRFDLCELVREVVDSQELAVPAFTFDLGLPPVACLVAADRQRIEQVLANLINNAVKYSGENRRVEIAVRWEKSEVITSVRDFGVGIPADEQEQIFERFFRARNVATHYHTGLGLGLFIAHGIVERHGGRIWLESVEHEGSTFYFSLPLAR